MWAQLSDEQKQTYGEEYFEAALRSLDKYTKTVMSNECVCVSVCFVCWNWFPGKR